MPNDYFNLLPSDRLRTLRREYFLRLGSTALLCGIVVILAAAALLLPMYVFLSSSVRTKEVQLAMVETAISSGDESAFSLQLEQLTNNAKTLTALAQVPSISEFLRALLAVPHPGITLSNFSYTAKTEKIPGKLSVSGSSATREALRTYQLALQAANFASSADLPVSAYAQDADIAFTITITLAP